MPIHNISFDEQGKIPAVLQDAGTNEVIALCFIDRESLTKTLESGETSLLADSVAGINGSHPLLDIRLNSDVKSLTILIQREPGKSEATPKRLLRESPAAKTSSSGVSLVDVSSMEFGVTVGELYALISERQQKRPEGSYTTYLFNSGLDKILKKIAEESGEVIIAAKNNAESELISEVADLVYHLLVLLVERDVKLGDVGDELIRRAAKRSSSPEPN
jgi:phosphoribosyl-ATP pyrophosphohydrolase/phosphoribosyl-AMP cyclohydrolase